MTREQEIKMYSKLSKKELIELLINSNEILNSLTKTLDNSYNPLDVVFKHSVFHATNHPVTGEPLGATYTTIS